MKPMESFKLRDPSLLLIASFCFPAFALILIVANHYW